MYKLRNQNITLRHLTALVSFSQTRESAKKNYDVERSKPGKQQEYKIAYLGLTFFINQKETNILHCGGKNINYGSEIWTVDYRLQKEKKLLSPQRNFWKGAARTSEILRIRDEELQKNGRNTNNLGRMGISLLIDRPCITCRR